MSGGYICNCVEKKKPIAERAWLILDYKCNHSAFNGYHYTSSDYSAIQCQRCMSIWRTKAAYVDKLKMRKT
jgi:hypothetical protein